VTRNSNSANGQLRCRARREQSDGLKGVRTENGSSQGQNLALTGLFVPISLQEYLAHKKQPAP